MTNYIAISQLPGLSEPSLDDLYLTVKNNQTYKGYLQQLLSLVMTNLACPLATTANLTATYDNGPADDGVGATLTNASTLGALAIDGVTVSLGIRILVKNQSSQFENGIYIVTEVGDGSTAWVLTRSLDFNQASNINSGALYTVYNGTDNARTQWIMTAIGPFTVGTTNITFVSNITAGTGLTKTNNSIVISNIKADLTSDIGGAGAGPVSIVVPGLTTSSIVTANIKSSSNPVYIEKVESTVSGFDITFSADPGASCFVYYIACKTAM